MRVSVIIAVKGFNDFLRESLEKCMKLLYQDYEILVLPDAGFSYHNDKVRVIPTGPCLPARKRDMAVPYATGEILAFLDDDAYPCEDWLTAAVKDFQDPEIAAVGGPAVTPPTEALMRRAGGHVYESLLVSGNFRYRYVKDKRQFVDDYPSCNLLVRKTVFESVGGFQTRFWPGEDTFLCLEITRRLKQKILYDPDVLVFHHRRPLYGPHLRQIASYALHRGYFAKHFPQTSLRWQYFVPTAFLLWLLAGGAVSLTNGGFCIFYGASLALYAAVVILSAFRHKEASMNRAVSCGIFLTHCVYGFYFIWGLLKNKLEEEGAS
jgi:GT2 family glycosyltransferase